MQYPLLGCLPWISHGGSQKRKGFMKSESSSVIGPWVRRRPIEPNKQAIFHFLFLAFAIALMVAATPAKAQITNTLLANPSFDNANSGHAIPTGWTYFKPQGAVAADYWIINPASANDQGKVTTDAEG